MFFAAKTRENTASVTRGHELLSGNRGNLCVEEFRWDSTPPVREKVRVDTSETTRDWRGHEQRAVSGQLVNCIVHREK